MSWVICSSGGTSTWRSTVGWVCSHTWSLSSWALSSWACSSHSKSSSCQWSTPLTPWGTYGFAPSAPSKARLLASSCQAWSLCSQPSCLWVKSSSTRLPLSLVGRATFSSCRLSLSSLWPYHLQLTRNASCCQRCVLAHRFQTVPRSPSLGSFYPRGTYLRKSCFPWADCPSLTWHLTWREKCLHLSWTR